MGRLLLNYMLSDPYVDVALVKGHASCPREPRFVELNDEISDDVASRIDGCEAHLSGAARSICEIERDEGLAVAGRHSFAGLPVPVKPTWPKCFFGRRMASIPAPQASHSVRPPVLLTGAFLPR